MNKYEIIISATRELTYSEDADSEAQAIQQLLGKIDRVHKVKIIRAEMIGCCERSQEIKMTTTHQSELHQRWLKSRLDIDELRELTGLGKMTLRRFEQDSVSRISVNAALRISMALATESLLKNHKERK